MHHHLHKIFVCEFITGGGFVGIELPKKLLKEGMMMRDALLADLTELNCQISTTLDARLSAPDFPVSVREVCAQDDIWMVFEQEILISDAVWAIAPETDQILLRFAELTRRLGKIWLGCLPDAIDICGDKLKTYTFLEAHHAAIPTYTHTAFARLIDSDSLPKETSWIAKPRNGAGCEATFKMEAQQDLQDFIANGAYTDHIAQPFLVGQAASFCMLCKEGKSWLLSVNKQRVGIVDKQLCYAGSVLNDSVEHWEKFERLAQQIANWMPELQGFVGVDVIVQQQGLQVVEINPRLTTSYAGLREASGCNIAQLVLNMYTNENFSLPALSRKYVEVNV